MDWITYRYGGEIMLGRTPTADEKRHMDLVGDMVCYACEIDGRYNNCTLLHHVDGRTKPGAHFKVISLCSAHHQHDDTDPLGRIGVHPWKKQWERLYGNSEEILKVIKHRIEIRK